MANDFTQFKKLADVIIANRTAVVSLQDVTEKFIAVIFLLKISHQHNL